MKINDVIKQVDLSKRAVKYYEEQGLLSVIRDENGYRNYTDENIQMLKVISVYRKLGIGIEQIRLLMKNRDDSTLEQILSEKEAELELKKREVCALRKFIEDGDIEQAYKEIDYRVIADAIADAVPGFTGYYFMNHFLPYLQIQIETDEQQEAYERIVEFWDNTTINIPIGMKLSSFLMYKIIPKPSMDSLVQKMDQGISMYKDITPEKYEALKKQVLNGVKLKNNPIYKYSPAGLAQRKFMKELQNKGYNDIFIPNMIKLSPKYKEYHDAFQAVNDRICEELGLYYDSDYQLVMKKPN